jgi:hypothetical protein
MLANNYTYEYLIKKIEKRANKGYDYIDVHEKYIKNIDNSINKLYKDGFRCKPYPKTLPGPTGTYYLPQWRIMW